MENVERKELLQTYIWKSRALSRTTKWVDKVELMGGIPSSIPGSQFSSTRDLRSSVIGETK